MWAQGSSPSMLCGPGHICFVLCGIPNSWRVISEVFSFHLRTEGGTEGPSSAEKGDGQQEWMRRLQGVSILSRQGVAGPWQEPCAATAKADEE